MNNYFGIIYIIANIYQIKDKVSCSKIYSIRCEWCEKESLACHVNLKNNHQITIFADLNFSSQSEWFACCNN